MDERDVAIMCRAPLFAGLPCHVTRELVSGAVPRTYAKGQMIFQVGDPADSFFVVLEGWVKLFRHLPTGDEAVFSVFTSGETFAEAATFVGGSFPVGAQAVEASRLLRIGGPGFRQRLLDRPELCLRMLASMSQHLHRLVGDVEQLQTRSSTQRLARFLCGLARVETGPALVSLPFDKVLVAARLGMKPESLSRALAKLARLGVSAQGPQIAIRDVADLRDYAESTPQREAV